MSRKLIGAVAAMVAVVAVYCVGAYQGGDKEITTIAILAVSGLGGFQVYRQAALDEKGCEK